MEKMKIIKCAFTLLLLAQACAQLSAMPPEAAAIFEKAGVTLTDADLYRAAEAYNFWQQKGENVWPGVDMRAVPLQLVFPEKLDVIIGHPSPPADCVKENIKLPGLDKTFCHRPDRTFYYGFAAGQESGVPMVSLNTMEVFDEYANALMRKQGLAEGKYAKTYREYLGSLVHELLHAYQYSEKNFLPKKEKNAKRPKLTKLDYPYQDEENCLLLGLEGRSLAGIMDEKDPARIKELWLDFMAARAARRARLPRDIVSIEQYMELTEGTARYAGWSVEFGRNDDVKPLQQTTADPRFAGYASTDTVHEVIKARLATLEHPTQSYGMGYTYYTGAALAYTLDKAAPGWKKGLFRKVSGFESSLDTILLANIRPDGSAEERLKRMYARYDADKMRAMIRLVIEMDLAANKVKLDKFRAEPGKRCVLVFRDVKPDEIQVGAPAMLTEYKSLRIFERGVTVIEYNSGKKSENSVNFSRSTPVLQDRQSGRFELVPGSDPTLGIKAKKTAVKNGVTIYSGGVELDNGVFSWKGKKLEVSEKEGVTTLTF